MSTSATTPPTGPATPEGRAVSARNATTHGLFARDVVLPMLGEDPAAYEALLQQLITELPPRNLLERHYLEQIAAASWRLRRLHRWQAQVYEDDTLAEDERLDRLDKTLRHETTLTRQIDRAVRTLNRDLKWLFEGRARDEAFYHRDLTPNEVRAEPELEIEVQREVWRRLRPAPAPDLGGASLDNTAPLDDTTTAQNCENEPPAPVPPPVTPSPLTPPELGAGGPPSPSPPNGHGEPRSPLAIGSPPPQWRTRRAKGRDRRLAAEGGTLAAEGGTTPKKRENELFYPSSDGKRTTTAPPKRSAIRPI